MIAYLTFRSGQRFEQAVRPAARRSWNRGHVRRRSLRCAVKDPSGMTAQHRQARRHRASRTRRSRTASGHCDASRDNLTRRGISGNAIQIGASASASKVSNAQDTQRFTASTSMLKSDIAKLTAEIKRDEARVNAGNTPAMSAADVEGMKTQLDRGLQEIRKANSTAKAC